MYNRGKQMSSSDAIDFFFFCVVQKFLLQRL